MPGSLISGSNMRWARASASRGPRALDAAAVEAPATAAADEGSDGKSTAYPFATVEAKWQEFWEKNQTFRTPDEIDTTKPKYYVLDMFPYPR